MKDITDKESDRVTVLDNGALMPFNLPRTNTIRWIARRKAEVVAAVHAGVLSRSDACRRYRLSPEEFREWECHYKVDGVEGLRVSAHLRRPHALH